MVFLANVLIATCIPLSPEASVTASAVQTTVVLADGGTVLLGGLKRLPKPVNTTETVPDGGTILLGGLKRLK